MVVLVVVGDCRLLLLVDCRMGTYSRGGRKGWIAGKFGLSVDFIGQVKCHVTPRCTIGCHILPRVKFHYQSGLQLTIGLDCKQSNKFNEAQFEKIICFRTKIEK